MRERRCRKCGARLHDGLCLSCGAENDGVVVLAKKIVIAILIIFVLSLIF